MVDLMAEHLVYWMAVLSVDEMVVSMEHNLVERMVAVMELPWS